MRDPDKQWSSELHLLEFSLRMQVIDNCLVMQEVFVP
jgi:hypothetical protein